MEITASLKYFRIAPRKVRLVTGLIKGLSIEKAEHQLKYSLKRSGVDIYKLLESAKANAINNFHLDPKDLYISKINVTDGPTLKRSMPRARGSAYVIRHRSCHVTLFLKPVDEKHIKTINVVKTAISTKVRKNIDSKTNKGTHTKSQVKTLKGNAKNIIQRKVIN
jgi:large subunit ribosomal protein L22